MFAALAPAEKMGIKREIIIMDNCSTDGTQEVLERYHAFPEVRIVRNKKNYRFAAYKRLFYLARGKVIIDVDDDILEFPKNFDQILVDYLNVYSDYGFLACNVVQNEKTDGSRPRDAHYVEDRRGEMVVEEGPTGGWCSAFRRKDYLWIKLLIFLFRMDARTPEDAYIASLCYRLGKRIGIIKHALCFHASGPVYARENNHLDREIEKFRAGGNPDEALKYERISIV
jgi:glycosyltransferase involved in cell wall biosynthesis